MIEIKIVPFQVNLKDMPWAEEKLEQYVNDGWVIVVAGGDSGQGFVVLQKDNQQNK